MLKCFRALVVQCKSIAPWQRAFVSYRARDYETRKEESKALRLERRRALDSSFICMSTGKLNRASALAALWRGCYTARIRQVAVNVDKENA